MAFDLDGQWALPGLVQDKVEAFDFDLADKLAVRWYPFGRQAHVVVDPHLAADRPVIAGTRIPVTAIQQRWKAGDSMRHLARDFGLKVSVVEEVIRLEQAA